MNINIFAILKKLINLILDFFIVILAGVLLIAVYNNVQINILGNSYSSFMGYSLFEVQTGSMEPEISAGDWIIVKNQKDYEPNDVVTFEIDGEFVTHRIVQKYGDTFVTQGDANNAKDEPITKEQIVGEEVKTLPTLGILRKTILNPIVLIGLIIVLYLFTSLFKKKATNYEDYAVINSFDKIVKKEHKKAKKDSEVIKEAEEVVEAKDSDASVEKTEEVVEHNNDVSDDSEPTLKIEVVDVDGKSEPQDLEKTMLFRMISVDSEDVDETSRDSVLEEVEERTQEIPTIEATQEAIDAATEEKVKMTLELIQKKRKKCNNFIEKAILLKREEIEEIVSILNLKQKYKLNEPTIKDKMGDIYIDAKYYNNAALGESESSARVSASMVEKTLLECSVDLFKSYKGSDEQYHDKVKKFLKYMILINKLEEDYINIEDTEKKRDVYTKKITKYLDVKEVSAKELNSMVTNILRVQRSYGSMMKFLFNKLDSGMFTLSYKQIGKEKIYVTDVEHNLQFSKMYSDYIVDKTYSEGLVAEDKIEVLATLLSSQLVKDMFAKVFNKTYVVSIPDSLFEKDKKLEKIIGMFDDGHAKNSVLFLLTLDTVNNNKKIVKKFIKNDYHIAINMCDSKNIRKKDEASLYLADKLFISKGNKTIEDDLNKYPSELTDRVIYTDVLEKIGK